MFERRSSKILAFAFCLAAIFSFTYLLTTPRERILLTNTLLLSAAVIAISIPIGSLIGVLISRTDLPGRKLFYLWIAVALLTPLHLQAAAWQMGIGIQGWFSMIYVPQTTWWFDGWLAAIWVHSFAAIPWVAWIVSLAAVRTAREVEEAALLESPPRTVFLKILLPQLLPTLGLAALLVIVQTATEIGVTDFFRVRTWAEEVYAQATGTAWIDKNLVDESDKPWGLVHPVNYLAIICGIVAVTLAIRSATQLGLRAVQKPLIYPWKKWRWLAGAMWVALFLFAVGVPMMNLIIKTGLVVNNSNEQFDRSWSPTHFLTQLVQSAPRYHRELTISVFTAACAASLAVIVSIVLHLMMLNHFKNKSFTNWLNPGSIFASALALLPSPIIGLVLIQIFNQPDWPTLNWLYDRSLAVLIIAQSLRIWPWCWLIVAATWPTVGRSQLELAQLEGASRFTILRRIIAPQLWPAWCAALIVSFELALGELAATILVAPPGWTPLSVRLFSLLHFGYQAEVSSICLLLFMIHAIGVVTVARLMKRFNHS